jgi:predicted RNase H-like HicB family nuclease
LFGCLNRNTDLGSLTLNVLAESRIAPAVNTSSILERILSLQFDRTEMLLLCSSLNQAFIVEVPELPGCATDGETYQEAVQNAEVVIKEWIATAQALGRTIPELDLCTRNADL